ncbi:hypothetical protein, partial [Escherichia coli]|uniref:hypothetical protein n=1 Tax=Escherichia coli TaxID=562 RepID=UPI0021C9C572
KRPNQVQNNYQHIPIDAISFLYLIFFNNRKTTEKKKTKKTKKKKKNKNKSKIENKTMLKY